MIMAATVSAKDKTVKIRLVETSDVHGAFFPYDFITRKDRQGSLARVHEYVEGLRRQYGSNVLLLENGDLLQGQPAVYYSNYVDTKRRNIGAEVINFMHYDAQTMGNHDVETGHAVYDKWIGETRCPVLGANIIEKKTGQCYVKPYQTFVRDGVKVAVLGMITPAVPNWLGETLWKDLTFKDMVTSCREWVEYLQANEQPDVIVGLFHSGLNGGIQTTQYGENETEQIAREVPGLDVIFYGHDHQACCEEMTNAEGGRVWLLNPANNAMKVAEAEVTVTIQEDNKGGHKLKAKSVRGSLADVSTTPVSQDFMERFGRYVSEVKDYVGRRIATCSKTITAKEGFFGNSAFIDFIHNMQLELTGADISMNAPLAFNAQISEGNVYVSDMFSLYKFENQLCVVRMTGAEVRRYLEMSYGMWVNTIQTADDRLFNVKADKPQNFKFPTYNFDSAAGIDYEVDVTKPAGQRVRILKMSNGQPFNDNAWYQVAMNSYRACGGGELLTRGAGIKESDIASRIVYTSEKDLRYYLMEKIEKMRRMDPKANSNWKFVPEQIAKPALERERKLMF